MRVNNSMEKPISSEIALWKVAGVLAACGLLVFCLGLTGLGWNIYDNQIGINT